MTEQRNIKQSIEYYEGLTGVTVRPDYYNDQQYLDFLINIQDGTSSEPVKESIVKEVVKKVKRKWGK